MWPGRNWRVSKMSRQCASWWSNSPAWAICSRSPRRCAPCAPPSATRTSACSRPPDGLGNGRSSWVLSDGGVDHGFGWQHGGEDWLDGVRVVGAYHPRGPRLELCIVPDEDGWAAARWDEVRTGEAALLVPGSGA